MTSNGLLTVRMAINGPFMDQFIDETDELGYIRLT